MTPRTVCGTKRQGCGGGCQNRPGKPEAQAKKKRPKALFLVFAVWL
jgi:hypothetical protein